jgi:hypothetical protein
MVVVSYMIISLMSGRSSNVITCDASTALIYRCLHLLKNKPDAGKSEAIRRLEGIYCKSDNTGTQRLSPAAVSAWKGRLKEASLKC